MNGYELLSIGYKNILENQKSELDEKSVRELEAKIKILDFFSECDIEDFCAMVDTSAFNEIIRAYVRFVIDIPMDNETKEILNERLWKMFNEVDASKVLKKYNKDYCEEHLFEM